MAKNVNLLHRPKVVLGLDQSHAHLFDLLLQELDLIVLQDDDRILLDELLGVLQLLLVSEEKGPLELVVQLLDFLINAEEDFLLAEVLNRLHTVSFLLVVGGEFRVADDLPRVAPALHVNLVRAATIMLATQIRPVLISHDGVKSEGRLLRVVS